MANHLDMIFGGEPENAVFHPQYGYSIRNIMIN